MVEESASAPYLLITLNGKQFANDRFLAFEWKSFMNGGYIIRGVVSDPYLNELTNLFITDGYLKHMRKEPTPITFKIGWQLDGKQSDTYLAYLIDVHAVGVSDSAAMEFIAIDPPSWYLNAGKGDGRVYKGKVSEVIKQVIGDYAPGVSAQVSDTNDSKDGRWAMMRMDPKTFIRSLLDWSCSMVDDKTAWITASDSDNASSTIIIKTQAQLTSQTLGLISISNDDATALHDFDFASDALISQYMTQMVTQGLSGVSGKYIDKTTDMKDAVVTDQNTGQKLNAKTDVEHSFTKPTGDFSTSIIAIPELAGGEMGMKYQKYIDGRARYRYLSMLPHVMRLKVNIRGDVRFTKSTLLGVSTVNLQWAGIDLPQFFMGDNWMIYGFHHKIRAGQWKTELYLYRFDYNADAQDKP